MTKLLLGAIQVQPRPTKEETLNSLLKLIDEAGRLNVSAVCLNDYVLSWPPDPEKSHSYVVEQAETIPGPTIDALARKAKEHGMLICSGSLIEKDKDRYYVSSTLLGQDGEIIGQHRKIHLFNGGLKFEKGSGITTGTEAAKVYDTPLGKIGVLIDTESYDRKIIDDLCAKGPKLIFWPVSWTVRVTLASFGDLQITARSMSRQAKAYVISTNKLGLRQTHSSYTWGALRPDSKSLIDLTHVNQVLYPGGSIIVSKSGTIIGAAEDFKDDIAVAAVDKDELS